MTPDDSPVSEPNRSASNLHGRLCGEPDPLVMPSTENHSDIPLSLPDRSQITDANDLLPITPYLGPIGAALEAHDVIVVTAAPGAGKTTQIPQKLARMGFRVLCTQPTRIAAESLQSQIESQYGGANGEVVGYVHGRGSLIGQKFSIMLCSDGILLEMLISQDYFRDYRRERFNDVIMIDEAHLFNRNIEHILALYKKYRGEGRVPKLVVSSATMNAKEIADFLEVRGLGSPNSSIPIFEIPGRQFAITDLPRGRSRAADIIQAIEEGRGDVLDFHPGVGEIREMESLLRAEKAQARIFTLHGKLSLEDQGKVHESTGDPRIILTTNVAETSLTIKDVGTVIDGGAERVSIWFGDEEILSLVTISKGTYHQRRGRGGRCKEGFYINYGNPYESLPEGHWEMGRVPCYGHTLRLLVAGEDPLSLEFAHSPSFEQREAALTWLRRLGFIDNHYAPTELGRFAARLPLDPREAKIVKRASELSQLHPEITGCLIDAAAVLSVRDFRESAPSSSEADTRIPPLTPLIHPSLHYLIRMSEALGNVAALETIFKHDVATEREKLFERYRIREAAVQDILFLREEIAARIGFMISPLGSRDLAKLPALAMQEAIASNWGDHIYYFAGRDRSGNPLYRDLNDPDAPLRKLSRYAEMGEPLLLTGKPFGIGLTLEAESAADILRLINNPCQVPRSWVAMNPNLQKAERQILEFKKREMKETRLAARRRR